MRIGFDNQKYLDMQSQHIRDRIAQFGDKLYLEFGGKLFDDYHASRVLPGFKPDSKLQMLMQLKDEAEIVIVINADDIEKNKVRGDLGITYDLDVLRLIDVFRSRGLYVGSVVLTRFADQPAAVKFEEKLTEKARQGIPLRISGIIKPSEDADLSGRLRRDLPPSGGHHRSGSRLGQDGCVPVSALS